MELGESLLENVNFTYHEGKKHTITLGDPQV